MATPSDPLRFREEGPEVLYATTPVPTAGDEVISLLKQRAARSPRKRCRLCTHRDPADALHDMLIVHARDAYVRPHRHIGKAESLLVVEGAASAIVFDDDGGIAEVIRLGAVGDGGAFYYRMPEGIFHSLLIESDWFVFHESTTGPFERSATGFADWAPGENEPNAEHYVERLRAEARAFAGTQGR